MFNRWLQLATCVVVLTAFGCGGSGRYQTRGHIIKGGAPFTVAEPDFVRVLMVPIPDESTKVLDTYVAEFNGKDGTFIVKGKDGTGMPLGKYRVALEYNKDRRDVFKGAYDPQRSPFIVTVQNPSDEITINLDKGS
jgi:hypothetical protein